jgi:HlyD family secretion protein
MSSRRTWLVLGALAVLVTVPVVLKISRGGEAKPVDIEPVVRHVLSPTILASGALTYQAEVKLVSEIMGRVRQVLVNEGDEVKKGQLLLQLDPAQAQAQVAQFEASLAQSRLAIERVRVNAMTLDTKWKRFQALREKGLVDQNSFDDIASQRNMAQVELESSSQVMHQTEAQLNQAREGLAKTQLRAPIDGKVVALIIKSGETAVPSAMSIAGSDLMTVADTSSLYAEVNVNETDVARVGVGQTARIVPAAFPDKSWAGVVERVASSPRTVAGQGKSYLVRIRLSDAEGLRFHTGMSCRAEIATRRDDTTPVIAVPVQAVRYEEAVNRNEPAKASLVVVKAGRANLRSVETGLADDAFLEITKGVEAGEDIVTGPARTLRFLREGDRVARKDAGATGGGASSSGTPKTP